MLIVGELINSSRKVISNAIDERNEQYIKEIAIEQVAAGADYLDVNCGTTVFREKETMEWLVNIIQEAVQVPLCIDSPNPETLEVGLALCKYGQPMINSITGEKERFRAIIPLVTQYKTKIIALCMDDNGIPETVGERLDVLKNLYINLHENGVSDQDMHFDPLVKPISSVEAAGKEVLDTIKAIKIQYPDVHFMCGLSNVSYGLPNRKVLNRIFMAQTMTLGMDGYILNPTDKGMMAMMTASQALLGQDSYCMNYLAAHRAGLFEE